MEVVILAAGQSKRLKKYTEDKPKCLIDIAGKTILERQLTSINQTNISKCVIVVGFKFEVIDEFIQLNKNKYGFDIELVHNELFDSTDNAYSLALGLEKVNGPVIILDGDIVFESALLHRLYYSSYENVLLSDNSRPPEDEDCKILEESGYAVSIGKKIAGQTVYTSMIKIGGAFLTEFIKELGKNRLTKEWYSEPLDRLLKENRSNVKLLSTEKCFRTEIDTEDDLLMAEQEVIARGMQ